MPNTKRQNMSDYLYDEYMKKLLGEDDSMTIVPVITGSGTSFTGTGETITVLHANDISAQVIRGGDLDIIVTDGEWGTNSNRVPHFHKTTIPRISDVKSELIKKYLFKRSSKLLRQALLRNKIRTI